VTPRDPKKYRCSYESGAVKALCDPEGTALA
jgi:hypothetical protein